MKLHVNMCKNLERHKDFYFLFFGKDTKIPKDIEKKKKRFVPLSIS
jgi:hypothetical protein